MPSKSAIICLVAGIGMLVPAWADDPDEGPGRGVARISVINGDVSVQRGDSGDLIAAAINSPLVVEDRILTGPNARAEVQFDWANMIRLSGDAEVRLSELEYKRYTIQVARGVVTFRVLRDHDAEVDLNTPSLSVRPVKRGTYRIFVHEDGTSEITVRSGEAEIFTPRGSERMRSGKTMLARGTAAEPEFRYTNEAPDDDWDRWNIARDRDLERSRSYSYVSRDVYGADDLDDHGRWVSVRDYGYVWTPRVAVGWAPYRYGRWSWVDYYGWSWVSYDPWGWAPYHYGRWFYSAPHGWCWWPGGARSRHYWSPGLVAFVGFGSARVGIGFGNVGWVPLAPYERYYPWYGRGYYGGYRGGGFGGGRGYGNTNVRIVNNINVTNVYRNARVDRGMTVVDQDGFRRGRSGNSVRFGDAEFSRASSFQGQLPITPGRESLRVADRDAAVRSSSGRSSDRFFSRREPAAVNRVSFDDQRRGMEQITRNTFGEQTGRGAAARSDGARNEGGQVATGGQADAGWRRVGEGGRNSSAAPAASTGRSADDSSWRRFGSPNVNSSGQSGQSGRGRGSRAEGQSGQFGQPSSSSSDGWRRLGERSSDSSGATGRGSDARSEPRSEAGDSGWRSFAGRGSGEREANIQRGTPSTDRGFSGSRSGGMDGGGRGYSDSIRISPPIVRERSSGRSTFDGGSRGGGGGPAIRSAPQSSAPRGGFSGGGGGGFSGGGGGGGRGSASGGGGGGGRGAASGGGGGGGGRSSGGGGGRGR